MELAATDQGCWEVDKAILPSRAEVAATALRISLKKVPRQTTRKSDTVPIQVGIIHHRVFTFVKAKEGRRSQRLESRAAKADQCSSSYPPHARFSVDGA